MKQYVILLNGQQYQVWANAVEQGEDKSLDFLDAEGNETTVFLKWDAWIDVAAVAATPAPQEGKSELANILDAQS